MKTQTEAAPSFDAKFSAAAMSNNIFRGYTLSNNLPSVTGTVEATYSIFFASVNGASVQIPELSHFQMTNTIGLRPEFGKLTVEGGVGYYTYPEARSMNPTRSFMWRRPTRSRRSSRLG